MRQVEMDSGYTLSTSIHQTGPAFVRLIKPFRKPVIRVPAHVFPAIGQMPIATLAGTPSRAAHEWKSRSFIAKKNLVLKLSNGLAAKPSVKLQTNRPIASRTQFFQLRLTLLAKETKQVQQ